MTRPLTAMIVFLPTDESQSVRVMDGRRSVRVANAMDTTLEGKSSSVQDMKRLISIGLAYRVRYRRRHALPAARLLRGRRRGQALHPGRRGGACVAALPLPADQGPGERAGRRVVQPCAREHRADGRG